MSDSRKSLSEWLQFLLEAGIPASQAANYAISFVENRIEKNMLNDLDKEYLRELGITALGDIIAILKHAKKVSTQSVKRAEIQVVRTADGVKKSTPASRLIDHFLKPSGSDSSQGSPKAMDTEDEVQCPREESRFSTTTAMVLKHSKLRSDQKYSKFRSDRVATSTPITSSSVPRRRVAPPVVPHNRLKEVVPVPKSRRVLPEHEGGYKIKMPSGTTPKTAKLLAQGKLSTNSKLKSASTISSAGSGVFGRLGSSQSSPQVRKSVNMQRSTESPQSTRPVRLRVESGDSAVSKLTKANIISAEKSKKDNSISFTVTGLGKVDPEKILSSLKHVIPAEKGVFGRLGGNAPTGVRQPIKRKATSTQSDEDEPVALDATPYIGVLKDGGKHSRSPKMLKLAPSSSDRSGFAVSRLATDSARTRLGVGQSPSTSTVIRTVKTTLPAVSKPAVTRSSIINLRQPVSVRQRLGLTSSVDSTVSSSTDRSLSARSRSTIGLLIASKLPASVSKFSQHTTSGSADVFSRLGNR